MKREPSVPDVNPAALPCVAFTDYRKLPKLSAVYFALAANFEVLYVGRAVNLFTRWILHHKHKTLDGAKCAYIAWYEVSIPELDFTEAVFIYRFNPRMNRTSMTREQTTKQGEANLITIKTSDTAADLMRTVAEMTGEKQYRLLERLLRAEFVKQGLAQKMFKPGPKRNGAKK